MRHHLLTPAVLTAGLAVAVAAGAAATTTARTAAAATVATAATAARAGQAGRPVFLVTGELITAGADGDPRVSVAAGGPGAGPESPGPLQALRLGATTYVMPVTAAPYLGRGLDLSLFEPSALAGAESGGRLPVRVGYTGALPKLPGVTITSSGTGAVAGYLTQAGARRFGAALARQFAADHANDRYGQDGLFSNGVSVTLAGVSTAPGPGQVRPGYVMHTLTVRGTSLSGQPDTGDTVTIIDADNASRTRGPFGQDFNVFDHGVAKFSVPAGHFWVIGTFFQLRGTRIVGTRLDVLTEITVANNRTVLVAAGAATSKVQFVTSRSATVYSSIFEMDFLTYKAPAGCCSVSSDYISIPGQGFGGNLYVSPMPVPPRTGALTQITTAQLDSPPAAPGVPYQYDVAYQSAGTIPPQHFAVDQASLATENARFYAATPSAGYLGNFAAFPIQRQLGSTAVLWPTPFPRRLTLYLTAGPSLAWNMWYIQWAKGLNFSGGQLGPPQIFRPGQRLADDWGAYPLHPAPFVKLTQVSGEPPVTASATRAGDVLGLAMTALGDNTPGHTGSGINPPFTAAGSYQIDQNRTKIAGGTLPHFTGFAGVTAHLSAARSLIRFVLNTTQSQSPLSTSSHTAWTWWSAHEAGPVLPPGWVCAESLSRSCAVQPLLTMRYRVAGEGLDGTASPGRQVIRVSAGHLQLAKATKITSAAVSVSFDGGQTWHPARMTGSGGTYAAVFNAPPGATVTLHTTATDAAGGSVTQTITSAYQTGPGSGAPAVRAACPPVRPRRARCYALYAPQAAVNAAIAARAAGQPVPASAVTPKGWGAKAIEAAYKLPVSRGAGQTVALVDAYSTPHLASDLGVYRKQYRLPACTTASGCLRIVNQHGQTSPLPSADPAGWGVEETLDVSLVSAACPHCKILLVEATAATFADLATAEDTAARLGAQVVSNSYGARESGFTQAYAKAYHHPGHVIVASSGDSGFTATSFPANLATVTAAGGTQLARASNARGWAERVWNLYGASGSGCSAYVAKPAWQHDPHCPGRTVADVAAVAWNIPIYDSSLPGVFGGPWLTVGGTSASSPLIAGVYALAGNAATVTPRYPYAHPGALFDVTKGNNDLFAGTGGAVCGYDYLCVAKKGYDAPTGLGSPHGAAAF